MEKNDLKLIVEIDQRSKSNTKRLDEHNKRLEELEKTYSIMEKMDYRMSNVEGNVEKINQKLEDFSQQKGKKWDKLLDYLFYAIIGTLLLYISTQLGIK